MLDPRLDLDAPEAAAWLRALTLDERACSELAGDDLAIERGTERFGRWCAQQGFTVANVERRLRSASLTKLQWHELLGETEASLHARMHARPNWLVGLLTDLGASPSAHRRVLVENPWVEPPPNAAFLALVEPLLERGVERFEARVGNLRARQRIELAELLAPIRMRLLDLIERTLILEMHIAGLTGVLAQEATDARYAEFVARLAEPDVRITTLQTYPVLARQAWTYVDQWVRHTAELLEALDADADELIETFGELGDPVAVQAVASDRHRDGRHVWIVEFAAGARVVFKPRPGRAEVAFQEFVEQLNRAGLEPELRVLRVVGRDAHLWLEYVEIEALNSTEEAARFHQRQGAWLVLLWVLACTDMHYENIRAGGAHPVPIDHETVLRNRLTCAPADDVAYLMDDVRGESVAGVGLLPIPHWDSGFGGYVDQSGMGVGYDDADVVTAPQVVGAGADIRVEVAAINPERQHNRAELDGELLDAHDYVDDVERGFLDAWALLQQHAADPSELLARFDDAIVRMVLRPTQDYAQLLDVLAHPEYLQDAIERERALLPLWTYPESQSWRQQIVDAERRQLLGGDVPWFGAVAASRDLLAGDGSVNVDAIGVLGRDVARERVAAMTDPARRDAELWMVRAALSRRGIGADAALRVRGRDSASIADELLRDIRARSIHLGADMRSWMTVRTVGAGEGARLRFAPDAAEQDLYAGLPGIALALGAHGRVTGSEASLVAAREALTTLRALDATQLLSIGAYDGAAGVAWCYMQLAEWLDDAFLLDAAARAVRYIEGALDDDRQFDIVSGAAGAIPVLLELERVRPGALDLAMRCGNHLLEHVTSLDVLPFQRGFAHGASGVAWALTRLSRITGEPRWEERACELLAAEDALIGTGQWSDGPGDTSFAAWCHGAPGIALARADMIRMGAHGGDEHVVEAAVAAAVAAPAHDSHGLCHGELGNIDALFDIADVLDRHDVRANAQQRLHAVLAVMTRDGVRSSGPRFLPNPGMMLGTSGIAWVLMRTATPQLIPSALLPGTVLRAPRTLAAS